MKILLIDDQRSARRVLRHLLSVLPSLELSEASNLVDARSQYEAVDPDLLLVDIRLSEDPTNRDGLEFVRWLRARGRATPVIMVTAISELSEMREAMRNGAQDYVLKDELSPEMLLPIVQGIGERVQLQGEVNRLQRKLDTRYGTRRLIGSSQQVDRVRRVIERVADADCTVLLRGETGTGKELAARIIHQLSARAQEPFVAVNCSALPGTLIESLIFGHERGAFTGADRRVRGQLEVAGKGTLLLDEIAEMPVELQAKLLRVLEDRRFRPLGFEHELPLEARVLAATHVDLERRIREGRFREDLYYRLNVVTIELPTLSERKQDIPELLNSLIAELPVELSFTEAAVEWLCRRDWPGNVRELKNALSRLVLLADGQRIDLDVLKDIVGERSDAPREIERLARGILALPSSMGSKIAGVERVVLRQALEVSEGNKSRAARLLGMERKQLERRLDRLNSRDRVGEEEDED
jgi:two-component system response regulator HydG